MFCEKIKRKLRANELKDDEYDYTSAEKNNIEETNNDLLVNNNLILKNIFI